MKTSKKTLILISKPIKQDYGSAYSVGKSIYIGFMLKKGFEENDSKKVSYHETCNSYIVCMATVASS